MTNEQLNFEDGITGKSRFTCYKPTYAITEWENKKVIREWDIMREKEDYFAFLIHLNELNDMFKAYEKLLEQNREERTQLIIQNQKLNEKCDELIHENRHTRKTIQDMLITERTMIGKNVIKQIWDRIQ